MGKISHDFMYFAQRFYSYLIEYKTEQLVRQGFTIGTARKLSEMDDVERLKNTTIKTLLHIARAISEIEQNDLASEFEQFLDQSYRYIVEVPRYKLVKETSFSPSMISNLRSQGLERNYQTKKFLKISDFAYEVYQEEKQLSESEKIGE